MRVATMLAVSACLLGGCAGPAPRGAAPPLPALQDALPSIEPPPSEERPPSPHFDAPELEQAVYRAVNRVRTKHGRKPLAWNDTLRQVARRHSRDMVERGFFGHTTPNGNGPVERAKRLGFPAPEFLEDGRRLGVSENLFRLRGLYDQRGVRYVARETVENWLESPLHRRALLSPLFQQQGLGVAFIEGQVYVTQNLF